LRNFRPNAFIPLSKSGIRRIISICTGPLRRFAFYLEHSITLPVETAVEKQPRSAGKVMQIKHKAL
jgi:hypothetical protein